MIDFLDGGARSKRELGDRLLFAEKLFRAQLPPALFKHLAARAPDQDRLLAPGLHSDGDAAGGLIPRGARRIVRKMGGRLRGLRVEDAERPRLGQIDLGGSVEVTPADGVLIVLELRLGIRARAG